MEETVTVYFCGNCGINLSADTDFVDTACPNCAEPLIKGDLVHGEFSPEHAKILEETLFN